MIELEVDKASFDNLMKNMAKVAKEYPRETYRAIVKILFDIKLKAQRKIRADRHIVTNRLRASIFVKTPSQIFAKRAGNSRDFSDNTGKTWTRSLDEVTLKEYEGAVGTDVVYGPYIESLDSFMKYAYDNVDMNRRFKEVEKNVKI